MAIQTTDYRVLDPNVSFVEDSVVREISKNPGCIYKSFISQNFRNFVKFLTLSPFFFKNQQQKNSLNARLMQTVCRSERSGEVRPPRQLKVSILDQEIDYIRD